MKFFIKVTIISVLAFLYDTRSNMCVTNSMPNEQRESFEKLQPVDLKITPNFKISFKFPDTNNF